MATKYDEDAEIRVRATFKNLLGTVTDPTKVTVFIKRPDPEADLITYTFEIAGAQDVHIIREGVGVYHVDITTDGETGTWWYRFVGDGVVNNGAERKFSVVRSRVVAATP